MSKKYVIDACALINASKNYNMTKKAFSHIWQAFNELVENGQLISSSEIFEELKDDDIIAMLRMKADGQDASDYLLNILEEYLISISK